MQRAIYVTTGQVIGGDPISLRTEKDGVPHFELVGVVESAEPIWSPPDYLKLTVLLSDDLDLQVDVNNLPLYVRGKYRLQCPAAVEQAEPPSPVAPR